MKHSWFLFAWLLVATPALAQSVEQHLPLGKPVEIALWGADLRISLQPGAVPHLEAHAVIVQEGAGEAVPAEGPTVELREDGAGLKILRAAGSKTVRLRVDVTLDLTQQVTVTGKDLDVNVEAPRIDFRRMEMRRNMALERGEDQEAPDWTDVTLQIENSRADLTAISGGTLRGRNSWFVVRQSANQLRVELEGGAAELRAHRGVLGLDGRGGEIKLHDTMGEVSFQLNGSRLEISDAEGKLEGKAEAGAALLLYDWGGHLEIESSGSLLELRNFRPGNQQLNVFADDSDVTVEAMESGQLDLDQTGGKLRVLDVHGKMKLMASQEADIELERLKGSWKCIAENSTVVADEVELLDVELTSAELRLADVVELRLTANGSEVVATDLKRISQALLIDSGADFELNEGSHAQVETRGESQVAVSMPMPCFVLTPKRDEEADPVPDVSGCTLGGNVGRIDPEAPRPSFLTLTQDGESVLEVRGM